MKKEDIIANHLAEQMAEIGRLSPNGLNHLEQNLQYADSLEHVQAMVSNALASARTIQPRVMVDNKPSDFVQPHGLSFLLAIRRLLVTGAVEVVDDDSNRVSLPAPVFILSEYDGGVNYLDLLAPKLAPGINIDSVAPSSTGRSLDITYSCDANASVERVSISRPGGSSYLKTLQGTRTTNFILDQPKIKIDDVSQEGFFSEPQYVVDDTIFGRNTQDEFFPITFEPDTNPNQTLRRIGHQFKIDNEKGLILMMTPNYKQGQVTQSNGQFWVANLMCFSNDWVKTAEQGGFRR